jgi:hypothetical protein
VIFSQPAAALGSYNLCVLNSRSRRIVSAVICLTFALSLHASVPSANSGRKPTSDAPFKQLTASSHTRADAALTSSPAHISFYEEFYPTAVAQPIPAKTGVLHRFASLIKRTVKLVPFI